MLNKLIIGTLIFSFFIFFSYPTEAAAQPKASCSNGVFTITNLPQDGRKVAVRLNDKANGWKIEKPLRGDYADKITPRNGKFTQKATSGHTYDWWIHIENVDGSYGSAIGGTIYCGVAAPSSLTASCRDMKLQLSWKKSDAADHYAVRIDDTQNPWRENLYEGDIAQNSVKGTKFTTFAKAGQGYNVWVHAVDSRGIFSPATDTFVSCKKEQSRNIFTTLSTFFSGFFQ